MVKSTNTTYMTIRKEIALRDFEFWSGGADRANNCSAEELDTLEQFFEETEPEDGWTDTDINDMFWFEFDTLAQYLGYKDEADFDRKHEDGYIDDDELKGEIDGWFQKFLDKVTAEDGIFAHDIVGTLFFNLFDLGDSQYDVYECDGEYTHEDYVHWLNALREQHDEDALYEALFEDNRGECETDGEIPSWEDFRDEIMTSKKTQV